MTKTAEIESFNIRRQKPSSPPSPPSYPRLQHAWVSPPGRVPVPRQQLQRGEAGSRRQRIFGEFAANIKIRDPDLGEALTIRGVSLPQGRPLLPRGRRLLPGGTLWFSPPGLFLTVPRPLALLVPVTSWVPETFTP